MLYKVLLLSSPLVGLQTGGSMAQLFFAVYRVRNLCPWITLIGFLFNLGNVGSACWLTVVSIFTHCCVFNPSIVGPKGVKYDTVSRFEIVSLLVGYGLPLIISTIGPIISAVKHTGPFYGPAGYWCWITSEYDAFRIAFHYAWIIVAFFVILAIYGSVFNKMCLLLKVVCSFTSAKDLLLFLKNQWRWWSDIRLFSLPYTCHSQSFVSWNFLPTLLPLRWKWLQYLFLS